jgi:NLI interacting factor-like phosphatase
MTKDNIQEFKLRPYAEEFLTFISQFYEIFLFSTRDLIQVTEVRNFLAEKTLDNPYFKKMQNKNKLDDPIIQKKVMET